jgi:hypothetical protein
MRIALVCLLCVALAACATPPGLPDGKYMSSTGAGELQVKGKWMEIFAPPADSKTAEGRTGTVFLYELRDDGELRITGSSNDSYYLFEVAYDQWRWTGSAIERRKRDGTVSTFTPLRPEG